MAGLDDRLVGYKHCGAGQAENHAAGDVLGELVFFRGVVLSSGVSSGSPEVEMGEGAQGVRAATGIRGVRHN